MTDVAALAYPVPPVPIGGPAVGIRWLRRNIARFTDGPDHDRRHRQATSLLAAVDIDGLRQRAAERTRAVLADGGPVDLIPVEVLAAAMGLPPVPAATVATIATAYQPGTGEEEPADEAVAELVAAFGGVPDEVTAATIAVLVQACAATAGLVTNAARRTDPAKSARTIVAETLREDPPVRVTRRVAPNEFDETGRRSVRPDISGGCVVVHREVVTVDLVALGLPFGAGAHECPGRDHAVAIATGIIETLAHFDV
jgi:cytochrome P450